MVVLAPVAPHWAFPLSLHLAQCCLMAWRYDMHVFTVTYVNTSFFFSIETPCSLLLGKCTLGWYRLSFLLGLPLALSSEVFGSTFKVLFTCIMFQVKVVSPKHRLIKVDSQEFGRSKVPLSPVTVQEEPVRTVFICVLLYFPLAALPCFLSPLPSLDLLYVLIFSHTHTESYITSSLSFVRCYLFLSPYQGGSLCPSSDRSWNRLLWSVWCSSRPKRQTKLGAQICTNRLLQLHGAIRGPADHLRLVMTYFSPSCQLGIIQRVKYQLLALFFLNVTSQQLIFT